VKNVKANQYLEIAPREICRGTHHFEAFFQDILDQGGEGIILRDPQSPYEPGRSKGFLKHKVSAPLPSTMVRLTYISHFEEISRC